MFFLQTARHTPESCPQHNDEARKVYNQFYAKLNELMQKNGIKMVGGWVSTPEHLIVFVYDVQDPMAMIRFMQEPEMMAWQSYQIVENRPVRMFDEAMTLLK
jgi:uncharacterized protein with GYD domain